MMMLHSTFRRTLGLLALTAVVCVWMPAAAQAQQPMRPFQGLFGSDPNRQQSLVVTFSLYGGYDDNVVADSSSGTVSRGAQVGSALGGGEMSLMYAKAGRRYDLGASANVGARYFAEASDLSAANYGAALGFSYQLRRYTRVTLSQAASFRPTYQLGLADIGADPTLGAGLPSSLDYIVAKRESTLLASSVSLEQQLGRRTSLSGSYRFMRQDFGGVSGSSDESDPSPAPGPIGPGEPPPIPPGLPPPGQEGIFLGSFRDLNDHSAGVQLRHGLTRNANLRVGYTYSQGEYLTEPRRRFQSHIIDLGVDYARAFTPSRRTTFSFSTGSGIIQRRGQEFFRLMGRASLDHVFSRRWTGRLGYRRGLGFIGAFDEPFFTDTVNAGLVGNLTDRLRLSFAGGYSTGRVGLLDDVQSRGVETVTGSSTLEMSVTQLLSLYTQYVYYQYEFQSGVALPPGLARAFDRQGVRAGLTLRLPLIQ